MFPQLEPGISLWYRQRIPVVRGRSAAGNAMAVDNLGAASVCSDARAAAAAKDVDCMAGTADAAEEQEDERGSGSGSGSGGGAAAAAPAGVVPVRTVWNEATVVWTDLQPAVPLVWLRPGATGGAGGSCGTEAADVVPIGVPISDIELRHEPGESSSAVF